MKNPIQKKIILTIEEAVKKCEEINNMLCGICYYGVGGGRNEPNCPRCHDTEKQLTWYYECESINP